MIKQMIGFLALVYCCSHSLVAQQSSLSVANKYAETINPAELEKHLRVIAADSMEGRNTGEKGQKKAANYIVKHFERIGLKPIMSTGQGMSYFQPFQIIERKWNTDNCYILVGKEKKTFLKDFFVKDSYIKDRYSLGNSGLNQEIELPTIYAGFGIETEDYSDFKRIDFKDKLLVVFDGEPQNEAQESLFKGAKTKDAEKFAEATQKGAKGLVIILGKDQASFDEALTENRYRLEKGQAGLKAKDATEMPIFYVSMASAAQILGISTKELLAKKAEIITKKQSNAGLKGKNIKLKAERTDKVKISSENVAGLLEGTDKKDEYVIITAHYDHIGMNKEGVVYNGADDDGSGTVSVLKIAEAFCNAYKEGVKPRRSILFMTVSGEEIGLVGSRFYTDFQPIFPLEKTVVNLNIDMVGRIDEKYEKAKNPNYIYLIGSDKLSSELHNLSEDVNKKTENIVLDYTYNDENDPNRFYYRSDHYNFAKNNIPIIFYFNGVHPDYHQPTDDIDKIQFPKMSKIARLVFYTAWEIANKEKAIVVDKKK